MQVAKILLERVMHIEFGLAEQARKTWNAHGIDSVKQFISK
jgi:hypothetical protein